jgi:hypothetical protein
MLPILRLQWRTPMSAMTWFALGIPLVRRGLRKVGPRLRSALVARHIWIGH